MTATRRIATAVAAFVLLLALSPLARAEGTEQLVQGRSLELVSVTSGAAETLAPGDTMAWAVKISAPGVEDGAISRTLVVGGDLAEHVEVSVEACAARPASTTCPGGTSLLEGRGTPSGGSYDLGSQAATDHQWLLVRVGLPDGTPEDVQSLAGTLSLRARGVGDDLSVSPGGGTGDESGGASVDGSGGSGGSDGSGGSGDSTGGTRPSHGTSDDAASGSGGFDTGSTGSSGNAPADQVPLGFLAATGMAVAVWLLAAAAILLLGASLHRGRRALTRNDEQDEDGTP